MENISDYRKCSSWGILWNHGAVGLKTTIHTSVPVCQLVSFGSSLDVSRNTREWEQSPTSPHSPEGWVQEPGLLLVMWRSFTFYPSAVLKRLGSSAYFSTEVEQQPRSLSLHPSFLCSSWRFSSVESCSCVRKESLTEALRLRLNWRQLHAHRRSRSLWLCVNATPLNWRVNGRALPRGRSTAFQNKSTWRAFPVCSCQTYNQAGWDVCSKQNYNPSNQNSKRSLFF